MTLLFQNQCQGVSGPARARVPNQAGLGLNFS